MSIISDGKTIWINDVEGCCIGRFSSFGIDIHKTAREQMESGSACLACRMGPVTIDDWRAFQAEMIKAHGIEVSDKHMPSFLRGRDFTSKSDTGG